MTTLKQVIKAHDAIATAEATYREKLRAALAEGTTQTEIAKALGVTREKLRQDAMAEAERQALRQADADRKAALRAAAKRSAPTADEK